MVDSQGEIDETTRAGRFAAIRRDLGLTGARFADLLNDAARDVGFTPYWTPPKVSQTETGKRDVSTDDAIVVAKIDPHGRGWTWPMYGVALRAGEDAYAALARKNKKRPKTA
jgi:hypothetical protein